MFEATAHLKVRDGELDGFKRQAAEIMRLAREKDTKTLRYDWFLSDDGTECEVERATSPMPSSSTPTTSRRPGPSSSATSPTTTP